MKFKFDFPPTKKEEKDEKTNLLKTVRSFANKKSLRAIILALTLSGAKVKASPVELVDFGKDEAKTGIDSSLKKKSRSEDTYYVEAKDFREVASIKNDALPLESNIEDNDKLFHLEIAKYFDTDSDVIKDKDQNQITKDLEGFLIKVKSDNVDNLVLRIFSSCDERLTSREGGNEKLANDRAKALIDLVTKVINGYQGDNLSKEDKENLISKIEYQTYQSIKGREKGVVYVEDLINPLTDNNFTKEEVEKIKKENPDEYKKLLDLCRTATFEVTVRYKKEFNKINPVETIPAADKLPKLSVIEDLKSFEKVSMVFDRSPSVNSSYSEIIKYIGDIIMRQNINQTKINFSTFSDKKDRTEQYDNSQDLVKAIKNIDYSGNVNEKVLSAISSALKELPNEGKGVVIAVTDESVQDISWDKIKELRSLATKKSSEIYLYCFDRNTKILHEVSLDALQAEFESDLFKKIGPNINNYIRLSNNRINTLEKMYKEKKKQLDKYGSKKVNKESYKSLEDRVLELDKMIKEEKELLEKIKNDFNSGSTEQLMKNSFAKERWASILDEDKVFSLNYHNLGNELIMPVQFVGSIPSN